MSAAEATLSGKSASAPSDVENGAPQRERREKKGPPRRWIIDRCDGTSKIGERHPPLRTCTVPPCVKWFPSCLEQNCLCENLGRVGIVKWDNQLWRSRFMKLGIASNAIGLILSIVACCAISLNYDVIASTSFTSGTATPTINSQLPEVKINMGLRAIALHRPYEDQPNQVYQFGDFCALAEDMTKLYSKPGECSGCAEISDGLVLSLILSTFSYFPSIFTNILRMYPNYDVNCQKAFGVVVTFMSMMLSLFTWQGYAKGCFRTFFDGHIPYDTNLEPLDSVFATQAFVTVDFDWSPGPGLIAIAVATILKVIDVLCHLALPSPTIARVRTEQEEYERLYYRKAGENDQSLEIAEE